MYSLGAVDTITNEYTQPADAERGKEYKCMECDQRVVAKKGSVRRAHFAHYAPTNTCTYYEHPNESQLHKDAKYKLAEWLANCRPLEITWPCPKCGGHTGGETEYEVLYIDGDEPVIEYRDPNGKYVADVALLNNGQIRYIFEVKHTHATTTTVRPDPWFEFTTAEIYSAENNSKEIYDDLKVEDENQKLTLYLQCCRNREQINCYWCKREQDYQAELAIKRDEATQKENNLRRLIYNSAWLKNIKQLCPANSNGLQYASCINCDSLTYKPIFHMFSNKRIARQICESCFTYYNTILSDKYGTPYNGPKYIEATWKRHADYIAYLNEPWLRNLPRLSHKVGEPTWNQINPCIKCGRDSYNPVFVRGLGYLQTCKICLSDHEETLKVEFNSNPCMIQLPARK